MDKLKDINEVKHALIDAVKMQVSSGIDKVDAGELGEVIDMIKDLASAEKDCMEACYYEAVTEAMDEDGEGRMGYDRWRYASGRFAPKGRGSRAYGYLPSGERMAPEPSDTYDSVPVNRRMGYTEGKEAVEDIIDTMGSMWAKADKDMRRKMRVHVEDLLTQMNQEEL